MILASLNVSLRKNEIFKFLTFCSATNAKNDALRVTSCGKGSGKGFGKDLQPAVDRQPDHRRGDRRALCTIKTRQNINK